MFFNMLKSDLILPFLGNLLTHFLKSQPLRKQKTPGLQWYRLISQELGRIENEDIKRENKENFWTGLVPRGKVGVLKQEEFLCTGKLLHRQVQGGTEESQKTRQTRDLEGRK